LLAIYLIGIVIAYFVLRYWRSNSPFLFAIVWPVGLLVLAVVRINRYLQGNRTESAKEAPAPPPLPRLGGIGTDDDEDANEK
jgi:hypothetical protein